jgi:ribonucleoside-diphosphate reductase alpha chain
MCKIGEVVVVGGVRRSALISLSNLSDRRMREAKVGAWWEENPQRALANNSAVYTEKPDVETFMEEWLSLVRSKSGERGIFSREASQQQAAKWGRRDPDRDYGTNPCSEIILRDKEFCNLTEVIIRPEDSVERLKEKIKYATIIGTIQSTFTHFNFLGEEWKRNCEEERLLGVSLTGIMDNVATNSLDPIYESGTGESPKFLVELLEELRDYARSVNEEWAEALGIKPSASITCVKPSGTVSELVDSAPGIHPRYAEYYIRAVRQDNKDPITAFLKDQGVPWEPDLLKPANTTVFYFKKKAPAGAIFRNDRSALDQLEMWLAYQRHWCEHKPSITVYVKEDEWLKVGAWVYDHFDEVSGVSFLPHSDHTYKQAPFTEVTKEEWDAFPETPELDWSIVREEEDVTTATQELSCSAATGCFI